MVEVLSPSSVKIDRWNKYQLHEKTGVKEYWLVDPANEFIEIHLLTEVGINCKGYF